MTTQAEQKASDRTVEQRILEAAEREFAARGFGGARTRAIAAAAKTNVAQIHYYFRTKEALYEAVLRSIFEEIGGAVTRAASDAASPVERVRAFIGAHFDAIVRRPHFPRLMMDALQHGETTRRLARETIRPFYENLIPVLFEGVHTGAFRPVDPLHAMLSAVGMNAIYFIARPIVEAMIAPDPLAPEARERRKQAVIDLVLYGLVAREGEGGKSEGGEP
jgi:AcrR family transcriptional regulator